jgi:NitT/TauT family transport system substrate-binding protein
MKRALITRRAAIAGAMAVGGYGIARAETLEKPQLKLALSVDAASFLPVYIAAEQTWKAEGLDVEFTIFRNDAEAAQALAGGSIDLSVQSFDGLISLINAEQPIVAFYAGFNQADFEWFALPSIKTWNDLKGQIAGVSSFGSLTDQLTRYALKKHGLDPIKDVKIQQIGPTAASLQSLKNGRLGLGILSAPFKWQAAEAGLTQLGVQSHEISPQWPKHAFMAPRAFVDKNPATIRALLRAHVAAIRLARANRELASKVLADRLKFPAAYSARAYDDVIDGYDERGGLPNLDVFWSIEQAAGQVSAPWPAAKFFDDRFVKTFDQWAG